MPKLQQKHRKPMKFEPFYMVYVGGGTRPSQTHVTIKNAKDEAERLCRKENRPTYVLAATHCVKPSVVPLEWVAGRRAS